LLRADRNWQRAYRLPRPIKFLRGLFDDMSHGYTYDKRGRRFIRADWIILRDGRRS